MFKFIFYLLIIYLIYRLLLGRFGNTIIKTKVYRHDTHHHHYNSAEKQESSAKMSANIKSSKSASSGKIGEYVDYEEID